VGGLCYANMSQIVMKYSLPKCHNFSFKRSYEEKQSLYASDYGFEVGSENEKQEFFILRPNIINTLQVEIPNYSKVHFLARVLKIGNFKETKFDFCMIHPLAPFSF
jgi:hypothetical protein